MQEEIGDFRLGYISEKYLAELVAATGSDEFLEKGNRPYIGMYDVNSGWFVPLRAKVSEKKPSIARYLTPFETKNSHFKNPGLDFQKAIYAPENWQVKEMANTLPIKQWEYIKNHRNDINSKFTAYVSSLDKIRKDSPQYEMSTVTFFPDGIKKIKERQYMLMQMNQSQTKEIDF
ncbi:hypothetical protein [Weissella minor]|uniref:hypothetical protein n=1 Tax=Weissella minor TaxID=1620 RepID=UPI003AF2FA3A